MKKVIIALVVLAGIGAGAGNGFERIFVDYSSAVEMPNEVRGRLQQVISSHCGSTLVDAKRVNVTVKTVTAEKVDNGLTDYTYKAAIEFIGRDNYNSLGYAEVELVQFQVFNPSVDNIEVLSLNGSACK